jgi:hypothetical protein
MLIKVKNEKLYQLWISYYERCGNMIPAEIRTMAFINSEKGLYPN